MRRTRAARYADCCDAYFNERYPNLCATLHPLVAAILAHNEAKIRCAPIAKWKRS
jgi:hypothetical protein